MNKYKLLWLFGNHEKTCQLVTRKCVNKNDEKMTRKCVNKRIKKSATQGLSTVEIHTKLVAEEHLRNYRARRFQF